MNRCWFSCIVKCVPPAAIDASSTCLLPTGKVTFLLLPVLVSFGRMKNFVTGDVRESWELFFYSIYAHWFAFFRGAATQRVNTATTAPREYRVDVNNQSLGLRLLRNDFSSELITDFSLPVNLLGHSKYWVVWDHLEFTFWQHSRKRQKLKMFSSGLVVFCAFSKWQVCTQHVWPVAIGLTAK